MIEEIDDIIASLRQAKKTHQRTEGDAGATANHLIWAFGDINRLLKSYGYSYDSQPASSRPVQHNEMRAVQLITRGNFEAALHSAIDTYKAHGHSEMCMVKGWEKVLEESKKGTKIVVADD